MGIKVLVMLPNVRGQESEHWLARNMSYCRRHRYEVVAVAQATRAAWSEALHLAMEHGADIIVVGRRDHLPPDRKPRVEVVAEEEPASKAQSDTRRPKRLLAWLFG